MPQFLAAVPSLPVTGVQRSVAFFTQILGFTLVHQESEFAVLEREAVELHLWLAGDTHWKGRVGACPVVSGAESFIAGTASCRIQVAGVEELYAELDPQNVVHPNGKLESKAWGDREFAVSDPDRNLITFFEALEVSPSRVT